MPLICCINIILLTNNNCNNVHLAVTSSNILDQWSPTFWARRPKTNSPLAWRASRRGLQNRGLFSSQQSSRRGGGGSVGDFEVPGTVNSFFSFLYTTRDRGGGGGGCCQYISQGVFGPTCSQANALHSINWRAKRVSTYTVIVLQRKPVS